MNIMKRLGRACCLSGYRRAARELTLLGYTIEANKCMQQYKKLSGE